MIELWYNVQSYQKLSDNLRTKRDNNYYVTVTISVRIPYINFIYWTPIIILSNIFLLYQKTNKLHLKCAGLNLKVNRVMFCVVYVSK